jgi:hypothetical protein
VPPRTRYALAWSAGSIVATVVFLWILTAGTGALFVAEPVGNFHDVQARAWLDGHWDVAPEAVTIEGFVTDGRTYVYFGPVPALLRLPVLAVTDSLDGRLTRPSLLVAFVVALAACGALAWRTRRLLRGEDDPTAGELVAVGATAIVIGTGSVLLYLGSRSIVYHETTLWAVALSLAAYAALLGHLVDRRWRSLALATALAVAAMLTRGSVGLGPPVALGLVALGELVGVVRRRPDATRRTAAALCVAAFLPLAAFSTVNMIKFKTLWSLPVDRQVVTGQDSQDGASRRAALADNGGSLFGLKFIPTTLVHYARPDAVDLQRPFPWVRFPERVDVLGNVTFDTIDPASSVTSTMPALVALGALGLYGVARRRALRPLVPLLGGATVGVVTVLTIAFIAHRPWWPWPRWPAWPWRRRCGSRTGRPSPPACSPRCSPAGRSG